MNTIIKKAYLISEYDFKTFDKLLKFLTEDNILLSCIALGVKKINSKNARSLFFGNLLEIEYFFARTPEKLSKIKKINTLKFVNKSIHEKESLMLINYLFEKIETNITYNVYKIYDEIINIILKEKFLDDFIKIFILIKLISIFGIYIETNFCINCFSKKNIYSISIDLLGFLCKKCSLKLKSPKWENDGIKLFYYLHLMNLEKAYEYKNAWNLLYNYLKIIYEKYIGIKIWI